MEKLPVTVTVPELERMANAIAASKLFGIQNPSQAMALMFVAQAEGRHPGCVARDYHIIQGRPALKADAILSRFQEAGGTVKWLCLTDTKAEAEFYHPAGGTVKIDWTIERAKTAGLTNPNWQKYPRAMLRARVVSEGVRTCYPAPLVGTYTPEEIIDMDLPQKPAPIWTESQDVTDPAPQQAPIPEPQERQTQPQPQAEAGEYGLVWSEIRTTKNGKRNRKAWPTDAFKAAWAQNLDGIQKRYSFGEYRGKLEVTKWLPDEEPQEQIPEPQETYAQDDFMVGMENAG